MQSMLVHIIGVCKKNEYNIVYSYEAVFKQLHQTAAAGTFSRLFYVILATKYNLEKVLLLVMKYSCAVPL